MHLNYQQTLEAVENFMKETGIRDFCTDICKGSCCSGCYTRETACHKNEGRRLSCSTYVCSPSNVCSPSDSSSKRNSLIPHSVGGPVRWAIEKLYTELDRKSKNKKVSPYTNIYFTVPPPQLFTDFKIDAEVIKEYYIDSIPGVKGLIDKIMKCYNKLLVQTPRYAKERFRLDNFNFKGGRKAFHYLLI